jgi:hypothetical protein
MIPHLFQVASDERHIFARRLLVAYIQVLGADEGITSYRSIDDHILPNGDKTAVDLSVDRNITPMATKSPLITPSITTSDR